MNGNRFSFLAKSDRGKQEKEKKKYMVSAKSHG